jgi:2',3'-cyclic-nucleotide 2'-phosphodiesterase (5'-nucleotidase family)
MPVMPVALASAVLLVAPLQGRPAQRPDSVVVVIAATTDVHGRVMSWDYTTDLEAPLGLVRVSTVVDSLRRTHPGRVVVVDVGDLLAGNPFDTYFARVAPQPVHPVIDAMNRIGYDAATPGNHEFNYGLGVMARALAGARFPYVSSNIVHERDGRPAVDPYAIVERAGVRIGITGATTPGVMVWDGHHVHGQLRFVRIAEAVPPVVRRMREEGADVTVLLSHSGLDEPTSYYGTDVPPENDAAAAIAATPELDVAVVGHTHREIAGRTVGTTLVVQPRNWAQSVAVVTLTLRRRAGTWQLTGKRSKVVPLREVRPDSALVRAMLPAHDSARAWARRPVGQSTGTMSARTARLEDTPVIDFINEVQRSQAGAQLSSTAAFVTSGGLPAGPVSVADLFSIYPYENTLKAIRISGADLRAYLEQTSRYYTGLGPEGPIVNDSIPGYNFDILSGADYELDLARPVGRRLVRLQVDGRDVADTDSFTLALHNYRQQGGGGYAMLAGAPVVYDQSENLRDLLVEEVRQRGVISPDDYFRRNWSLTGVRPSRDSIVLRVLATSDVHGALLPRTQSWSGGRPVGGAAAMAGLMNRLEAECACPTIRLDGGDVMQGTPISNLSYGRATVEAFNAMRYAAAAIGNHEFDWSVDTLAARMREARFAWVSANVRERATGAVPPWVRPWRMVTVGPLRIAVVGASTESTPTTTRPSNVAALRFDDSARLVDSVVGAARAERPDFVILVAHAGAFCERSGSCEGEILDLAGALRNRPDLIVAGHTHQLVGTYVAGIPIIEARSNGTTVGVVDFVIRAGSRTTLLRAETVWADQERADTVVAQVVDGFRRRTEREANRELLTVAVPLRRSGDQHALGNLIADAYRSAGRADAGLVNNGSIRTDVDAGAVSWGELFEVLPFQNRLVRLTLSGAMLRASLEHAAGGADARAHVSGLRVRVDPSRPAGQRVTHLTLDDGRIVEDSATYTLATTDFIATGGSGYAMLRGLRQEDVGVSDLDAFIAYLRRQPQPVRRVPTERRVDDGRAPETRREEETPLPTQTRRRRP